MKHLLHFMLCHVDPSTVRLISCLFQTSRETRTFFIIINMTNNQLQSDVKDEHIAAHLEQVGNTDEVGQVLETKYAGLKRMEAVKLFWRAILFCMILNWAALNDGVSGTYKLLDPR